MESFSQSHKNLQMFCADFWPSAQDCELILGDVGIDSRRINMSEPSIMRWLSIIQEMRRRDDGSMSMLVNVLMKQYPENKQLREVCAPWIPTAPAKETLSATIVTTANATTAGVLVSKKPKKLIPVVVDPDFSADADLVVPKLTTLWDAMIDTEKRITEMEKLWIDLHQVVAMMLGKQSQSEQSKE